MSAGLTAHDGFDHLKDVGLVDPRAALRAGPLRDMTNDNLLPVDPHFHLDEPRLVKPRAGAAAPGRIMGGHHRLLLPCRIVPATTARHAEGRR